MVPAVIRTVEVDGGDKTELTTLIGTLAKMSQHIDISVTNWRKVSQDKKDDLWSIVKEKFEFAPVETEEIRSWVMSDIGKKWKTWKYELKKRQFDSSLTVDEIVAAQTDTRVEKKDFKNLVTHWFCEDAQHCRDFLARPKSEVANSCLGIYIDDLDIVDDKCMCIGSVSAAYEHGDARIFAMLDSKINELEVELKDLKERQHIEMKEMKENQAAILQFMAKYKNHNSNEDFSNVLNTTNTNTKVASDFYLALGDFVIGETLNDIKRDDVQLLRKFGIQFKGISEHVNGG
ncbi:hypothetical protein Tco_0618143 [Tanacetum coccineum]